MAKLAANIIIESRKKLDSNGKIYTAISVILHLILATSIAFSGIYIAKQESMKPKVYRVSIATIQTAQNQGLKDRKRSKKTIPSAKKPKVKPKLKKKTVKKQPIPKKVVGLNTSKKPIKKKILKEEPAIPDTTTPNKKTSNTSIQTTNEKVGFSKEVSSSFDLGSVNFEYSYYLAILKDKVGSNWIRTYIGEGKVKIYFQIVKNGQIKNAIIEHSSGNTGLDKLALRAVLNSSPLPPLPEGYGGNKLGIHLWFNYNE